MSPSPITPSSSPQQPEQIGPTTPDTQGAPPTTPYSDGATSFEDPTGAWSRFLGQNGTPATPQEVNMFLSSLLKFFSKVIFAQNDAAAKRSAQQMKDAIEGRD